MDRRIRLYGLNHLEEPHRMRVLFMRYFGTIHKHRVEARARRFKNPPPDPALQSAHALLASYHDAFKALVDMYQECEKKIVGGEIKTPEQEAGIEQSMGDRQKAWAAALEALKPAVLEQAPPATP